MTHQAALDPCGLRQVGNIGAAEMNFPSARAQSSRHQLDKRRLAGAVGTDKCVPRTVLQAKIDSIGHSQCAEALVQTVRLQCRRTHRRNRSKRPSTPPRAKTTTSTIKSPIQKYQ